MDFQNLKEFYAENAKEIIYKKKNDQLEILNQYELHYNRQGQLLYYIENQRYRATDSFQTFKIDICYDHLKRPQLCFRYELPTQKLSMTKEFHYNDQGLIGDILERTYYNSKTGAYHLDKVQMFSYEGRTRTEKVRDENNESDGEEWYVITTYYDNKGREIGNKMVYPDGTTDEDFYSLDEDSEEEEDAVKNGFGHWIWRLDRIGEDRRPGSIFDREIKYYD